MKVWLARIGLALVALIVVAFATAVVLWEDGHIERWARAEVVRQLEHATGARVELGNLHLRLEPLSAELDQLTLHGRESAAEPPLASIERIRVGVSWRRLLAAHVELSDLEIVRPAVYIRFDAGGTSNLPVPPVRKPSRPWHEQIFQITIDHLRLDDGILRYNDRRIPLVADGGLFDFRMDYFAPSPGRDFYRGAVGWQDMRIAAHKWLPFRATFSAQFTLGRRGGSLDQFRLELPHSSVEARADWPDWTKRETELRYRAQLNLDDIRTLLRKPHAPRGVVESTGDLRYAPGAWSLNGYYNARAISIAFKWFHERDMRSRGTLEAGPHGLDIPDFQAWTMGGEVGGRVHMDTHTLDFTAQTRANRLRLARLFAAVQNKDFPVQTLHWDASVAVDSVTTWRADFKRMATSSRMIWTPLPSTPPGAIPASATIEFRYSMASNAAVSQGDISTPDTHLHLDGTISDVNSDLATDLTTNNLRDWDEMIDTIRGPAATPVRILGRAAWKGRITGHISHPMFTGVAHAWDASYDRLAWDEMEGNVSYSPEGLTLTNMSVTRGRSRAILSLHLDLTDWNFKPENRWNFTARLTHADTDDLQALAGTSYAARGLLSGEFQGGGLRREPQLSGNFQLDDFETGGFRFPKVSGKLELIPNLVRVAGVNATFGSGRLGGELTYQRDTKQVEFDVFGNQLPIDRIGFLQSPSLPLAGRADFHLTGNGPFLSPRADGTVTIFSLRAGSELIGDLNGRVHSDGRELSVGLTAKLVKGRVSGEVDLTLGGNYPIRGNLVAEEIDLDPFIESGLHLRALTSHSRVDGRFQLTGDLRQPSTIAVDADVSHVEFSFENVKLENVGPLRLVYRENEVRVQQANLEGPDSNFQLSGVVRFHQNQPLDLRLAGGVNLALAEGFVRGLHSRGAAQVDAEITGTFSRPRIDGRGRLQNAALNYGDIPIGLSDVNGELVFSSDHLSFTNVTAQAGGGQLALAGTVSFAPSAGRARYDIQIAATQVRVRYPQGMSWLLDADARFAGTTSGATLSGQVTLNRLLFTNGLDVAAALLAPRQATAGTESGSSFLQNLQLDFTVNSGSGSQLIWAGAHIDADANLRVRGTWNRPTVLGHVHLLSGEVNVRGDKYQLTRGDLNFANPLLLDPELNIEATTVIQQYQVTVDLAGRASALRLSYRSDPPLPESDVIALLALGYTGEESQLRTAGQPANFGATALLSQAISSEVGGRIQRLFGISHFAVGPELIAAGTESNAAARITVEQQVRPNLTITYSANATSNSEQVIQIEYAVTRDISIVALRDINGTFGIDVEFKKRFK